MTLSYEVRTGRKAYTLRFRFAARLLAVLTGGKLNYTVE